MKIMEIVTWDAIAVIIPTEEETKQKFRCIGCNYKDPCYIIKDLNEDDPTECMNNKKREEYQTKLW
ncbi:MAG: hypothetical protein UR25_C0004G0050 [Candidatus Nomurabacteria bacterium GW2011_GWE1_32_28]|uniref:Uncharacterized protein n=1 Tax=Candidatus Nomurabacteria bacterium GW2011_GWF1_31_48 TaxID=1618767 RepID=A0A0F9YUL6_9BACT|nr:MAG: hypothetical protein UR10_C0004G0049 [Candidatus Nomurabacteria bacterium GW2011_GWF2_30_133]KKP28546.1 MAG: hypothetical protein UR18_C0003G0049 [Candidatus Nomurabacteria bacterium GW2011_GWE2_31_40]KKP30141.1 MAG: hypothetical protein UR19_C0004G0049 [Candidatus Nomurabacteria bacterium GW2011_GWF1_31_48]KKP34686.1 MAG: hypothetical protein UR25_C0004G0050 [Candidatus Nomurabacteria bacterium GW2011_GWE1_32_28]HAS80855.1 hypothetical protein [Candidatus Nomurabacteria bacterium]